MSKIKQFFSSSPEPQAVEPPEDTVGQLAKELTEADANRTQQHALADQIIETARLDAADVREDAEADFKQSRDDVVTRGIERQKSLVALRDEVESEIQQLDDLLTPKIRGGVITGSTIRDGVVTGSSIVGHHPV